MSKSRNFVNSTKRAAADKAKEVRLLEQQRRREIAIIRSTMMREGDTKTAIMAALRKCGVPGNAENVARVKTLDQHIYHVQRFRYIERANARVSTNVTYLPAPNGRPAICLPSGKPVERLDALRRCAVRQNAMEAFRFGAPGGTSHTVKFAEQSSDVGYSVSLSRNYNVYRGAYKGWGANVDNHRICVPRDWRHRVERKGLALLGGLLTLDARPLEAPAGINLYAAVWAGQGRGYDVKTERGFIATGGGESFHAETADGAISGLLRKCRLGKDCPALMADFALSVNQFITKYSAFPIDVSLDDARKSGSCEYGIRSWCASVGIDMGREKVPMADLLDGFRRLPQTEVRRAVLHAVRHSPRANRSKQLK